MRELKKKANETKFYKPESTVLTNLLSSKKKKKNPKLGLFIPIYAFRTLSSNVPVLR